MYHRKIYKHIYDDNIMAEQQKGCTRSTRGCKEQLIVDSSTTTNKTTKMKSSYYICRLPESM
jgi:hypothetical protein